MKKLEKIHLKKQEMLTHGTLKKIVGGASGMCCDSDGICAGHYNNCSKEHCVKLYGSGAFCS